MLDQPGISQSVVGSRSTQPHPQHEVDGLRISAECEVQEHGVPKHRAGMHKIHRHTYCRPDDGKTLVEGGYGTTYSSNTAQLTCEGTAAFCGEAGDVLGQYEEGAPEIWTV